MRAKEKMNMDSHKHTEKNQHKNIFEHLQKGVEMYVPSKYNECKKGFFPVELIGIVLLCDAVYGAKVIGETA